MPSLLKRPRGRTPTCSVALIGPDGAGKSSVTRLVREMLPVPCRTVYMGVNLDASSLMLPTTRLIVTAKRVLGGRADLTVSAGRTQAPPRQPSARVARNLRSAARMANWIAEEWFRQAVAAYARLSGKVVIFDRHFFCDYYAYDVVPRHGPRPLSARVHGYLLERAYPRPDLVLCLDAPASVLHARKREQPVEQLEALRRDYLRLAEVFDSFVVMDATRPADVVAADVVDAILRHLQSVDRTALPASLTQHGTRTA